MIGFLFISCANLLITAVYLGFQALGGAFLGAKVEEVNLFFLGPLCSVRVRGVRFTLGFFPTGGSVKFGDEFQTFAPLRKILIAGCGLFSYALIALFCLGFGGAMHHVGSGYGELFRGAVSPLGVGASLVASLAEVFQNDSFSSGLGTLAAKFFAFNSLPLATLSGGFIVTCLAQMMGFRAQKSPSFQTLSYLAALLLLGAWTVAFVAALGRLRL